MRILVVTSQFPIAGDPHRGRAVYQTVRELSRLAEVTVVCPVATYPRLAQPGSYVSHRPDGDFQPPDVPARYVTYAALPVLSRPFNGFSCAAALRRFASERRFDVVLSYWLYPDAFGALDWARREGVPFVAGARGSDLRVRDPISRMYTRYVVRRADRLLTVSADLAAVARCRYGADYSRIAVIRNGCDTRNFRPGDRLVARTELGVAAKASLVVYVGRLVREKGLIELVRASSTLASRRPGVQVALVGDGPARGELAALVRQSDAPVLLPGAAAPEQVARWMIAADVVTLPSYSEGYPNVLVEALACGRPIVATPVGGVIEIADDSSAVLVPPRDPDALARGLEVALERRWDETQIAGRFGRSWREVAAETLAQCQLALHARKL